MTRRSSPAVLSSLVLVLAAGAAVGVAEGAIDLLGEASESELRRAPALLAYAVATWLVPLALIVVPVALIVRSIGRAPLTSVSVGVGVWGGLATWVDGWGAPKSCAAALVFGVVSWVALRIAERLGVVRRAWLGGVLVALGFVAVAASVSLPAPTLAASTSKRTPLIVLNIDTLRRDALSIYGADVDTPHIDRIGREGWVIDDVLAPAGWTLPSVVSLFSSRTPRTHGVTTKEATLPDDVAVLPEHLASQGYETVAVLANPILAADRGFARGFTHLDEHSHQVEKNFFWVVRLHRFLARIGLRADDGSPSTRKMVLPTWDPRAGFVIRHTGYLAADEVTDAAIDWIGRADDSDLFLYLHYYDPHDPYLPHPSTLAYADPPFDAEHVDEQIALYRDEVAFLDEHVGRLFDVLAERRILERAVIVVTSDHGEEFLDHGRWFHGHSLYDELVRIPLLVRFPDDSDPGPAPRETSVLDIAPTILDAIGAAAMPEAMGRSLLASSNVPTPRFAEHIDDDQWQIAVRTDGQHWTARLPGELGVEPGDLRAFGDNLMNPPTALRRWTFDASLDTFATSLPAGASWSDGALRIDAQLDKPIATRRWTTSAAGLLAVDYHARLQGEGTGRLALRLDRRDGETWFPIATTSVLPDRRQTPLVVRTDERDVWRLVVTRPDAMPSTQAWLLDDITVTLDDPQHAFDVEGFDITADPEQRHDLADDVAHREQRKRALALLVEYATSPSRTSRRALTTEDAERLKELGYLK